MIRYPGEKFFGSGINIPDPQHWFNLRLPTKTQTDGNSQFRLIFRHLDITESLTDELAYFLTFPSRSNQQFPYWIRYGTDVPFMYVENRDARDRYRYCFCRISSQSISRIPEIRPDFQLTIQTRNMTKRHIRCIEGFLFPVRYLRYCILYMNFLKSLFRNLWK
jgi:hypothetical protein